jgi:hypothetical protein
MMEKQNETLRDRLLARLPQPENVATYQAETATLLAKHEKALFWEKAPSILCSGIAVAILWATWFWGNKLGVATTHSFLLGAGLFYFLGAIGDLRYRIIRNKVDLLKEIKQLQLQVLEVQASLRKSDGQ